MVEIAHGNITGMNGLEKVSIFSKLSPEDMDELSRLVVIRSWEPDRVVFFEGEPSDSLYSLLKGSVKITKTSPEGQSKTLGIIESGGIFGELAMLDGQPRSATVTSCGPAQTGSISHRDFRKFVATRPDVLWKMLAALCERVRTTSNDVLDIVCHDVHHRLITALTGLTNNQAVRAGASGAITLKVTVRDLSAMAGASAEEVKQLLRRYREDGLIELGKEHELVVRDRAALARAMNYGAEWL